MFLIILTGAPASGKSSFAESLSKSLGIPWISKDAYKVELFEQYGFRTHEEKKKLSIRGEAMLIERVEQAVLRDENLIVDNNFKNFNAIREIILRNNAECKIICFYLYADSSILANRYNLRISSGKRELPLYTLNMYPVVDGISEFHKPLTSEQVDNIQSNVTEEVFGDVVVRIGTNTIARDYDAILHQMLKTITDNVKEN
jgi:adenylate kinase family enzyme